MGILDAPGTIREFNTGTSNINTPNIATEDDAYEFVFKETDFGTEATVATTTIEDTEYKTIHNIEMELVEDTDLTENVWGADSFGVFESNDFGLCAPANIQMKTLLRLRMLTSCNGLSMIKQSLYKKT